MNQQVFNKSLSAMQEKQQRQQQEIQVSAQLVLTLVEKQVLFIVCLLETNP